MAAERGEGPLQEMMEVDRRVESEESGDDEGKKQASCIVTDLSHQSLRDEQNGENLTGEAETPVDMESINLDPEAEDVDLNHFRIGKIEGFEVLKKVKTLCLRQNLVKCIENLEQLQTLRELDLYDNQIRKIENLEALTDLEILDISFNLLRHIEGLDRLTQLKKLFLVNNKISKIENLSNLQQLQMLELGSNRIRAIENIDTLTNLDSLFLGKNKITKLQNLDALTNLTVLSIQSNRLTKIEGLQNLVNLRELYLSHNGIEVIEGLENNNKLTMLDIASNRIKKIENVSHLTELQEFWLYEILATTPYGHLKQGEVGVDRLLSENVFAAAFPLHEGPFAVPADRLAPESLTERQVLFQYWARWQKWNRYQPLDHIRRYFGEKIALYFAWLGFYTGWLLPAAVVGTLVFIAGIFLMLSDIPAQEICESEDQYQMCPLCKECPQWQLSSICSMFKAGRLFDHGGTIFFSIFMSLWAVTFLEYWKRMNATLAHRWDCSDFEDIEERPRPQFTAMAPMTMENPITGAEEPYFPKRNRVKRVTAGLMVIIMMIAVVVMFLISIILYRAIVSILVSRSGNFLFVASASRIASLTGSVVNLIFILILSKIYIALAHFLTKWEMHRTQTKYEDAFTFKVFVFQFVNFYSSPIYIAFFKGRFVGYPGHYKTLLGIRNEDCGAGGCLIELAQELLVIMVGKQVINNVQEIVIPKLKGWWQKYKLRSKKRKSKEAQLGLAQQVPWESNYELLVCEGLFDEYLEMVLQFGFITIFVAACPLAPLFALLNNWVEIRLDAQKFVCEYRRPVAERAQGIGIWFYILEVITHLAVISNAFLIAFTSDFLPRLYYQYTRASDLQGYVNFTLAYAPKHFASQHNVTCRYRAYRDENGRYSLTYWNLLAIRLGFIIVFEHVVFFIARVIDLMVPDIPESLEIKVKRERYLAKQALAENQVIYCGYVTYMMRLKHYR
ncbi:anoctamin-7 isoform X3 [Gopherus flavomarginatus]|uniref:anoctamin-7 isoform X3 n=1 Tax=Gopherus flavomarginatus TaxID=286002 RepID=UPI0021CC3C68|nr:anoctamin-7 isoform X3 [Gopherus flavomarginatus]